MNQPVSHVIQEFYGKSSSSIEQRWQPLLFSKATTNDFMKSVLEVHLQTSREMKIHNSPNGNKQQQSKITLLSLIEKLTKQTKKKILLTDEITK